jgi:hypothetical protein
VLDPFAGGGSTFESAEKLKRLWIGAEIVDCGLIRERFGRNVPEARDQIPQALAQLFKEPNPTLSIDLTTCRKSSRKSTTTEPENGLNGSVSLPSLLRSGSLMA